MEKTNKKKEYWLLQTQKEKNNQKLHIESLQILTQKWNHLIWASLRLTERLKEMKVG